MSTLKELLQKATPGPWALETHDNGGWRISSENAACMQHEICSRSQWHRKEQSHANAAIFARCNPQTMALVLEALESAEHLLSRPTSDDIPTYRAVHAALQALNTP